MPYLEQNIAVGFPGVGAASLPSAVELKSQ